MKNEVARREIEFLDYYLQNHSDDYSEESHTAMMMARDALKQEPCEDAISRKAVLEQTYSWSKDEFLRTTNPFYYLRKKIKALPPVTPTQKWVPVSERMPEEVGTYMTTVDYGCLGIEVGQRYYHGKCIGWEDNCVIAWMPLPGPYKAESEE